MSKHIPENWRCPIYESKDSEKVICFANSGHNMSEKWWSETYKALQSGMLYGVYETKKGLRRILV